MRIGTCPRAQELRDTLLLGHWPRACAEELRAHVAGCPRCSELVLLAEQFEQARLQTISAAPVASADLLWVRAQARRRQAALERAARPVAIAQVFGLAVGLAAAVAFLGTKLAVSFVRRASQASPLHVASDSLLAFGSWSTELVAAVAILLLAGCVALVLTSEKNEKYGR